MTEYRVLFIDENKEIGDVDHTSYPKSAVTMFADDNKLVIETMDGRTIWSNVPEYPVEPLIKMPVEYNPKPKSTDTFTYNDGGREETGRKGFTGDCVTRAIAIATEQPYDVVYKAMAEINGKERKTHKSVKTTGKRTARNGIYTNRKQFKDYMIALGWVFVPTMGIGTGCKVHLKAEELPSGRIIARVSKHLVAVIDGIVNDTYDSTRDGTRCVYGYWIAK